jgi:hypothetical protein
MALNDAALVLAANAVDTAITHMQLHSSGTNPAANAVGSRVAVNGSVDATANSAGEYTVTSVTETSSAS